MSDTKEINTREKTGQNTELEFVVSPRIEPVRRLEVEGHAQAVGAEVMLIDLLGTH